MQRCAPVLNTLKHQVLREQSSIKQKSIKVVLYPRLYANTLIITLYMLANKIY